MYSGLHNMRGLVVTEEEIMRLRLREYRDLLEVAYLFIYDVTVEQPDEVDNEKAENILKAMEENGIGK